MTLIASRFGQIRLLNALNVINTNQSVSINRAWYQKKCEEADNPDQQSTVFVFVFTLAHTD